jgi:GMP reductase
MDTVGTFEVNKELSKNGMLTCIHKFYTLDDWKKVNIFPEYTIPSIGANKKDFEWFEKLNSKFPDDYFKFLCIDVANGYGEYFIDFIKRIRDNYPNKTIIAGNVVTGEMVEELILTGADIIKVGIGPGSCCTTRIKTGVGYPQLSAVIECADAAHGLGGHIIADGGCVCPGDIAKAFGAGADFVMLGGMLAGHDESGGEIIEEIYDDGSYKWTPSGHYSSDLKTKKYKTFYGMSSDTAQNKYYEGQKKYRASEGRTVKIPYKGQIEKTINEILGGLRSACTYVGAKSLKELSKRTTFIRVNNTHNKVFIKDETK